MNECTRAVTPPPPTPSHQTVVMYLLNKVQNNTENGLTAADWRQTNDVNEVPANRCHVGLLGHIRRQ